MPPAKSDEHSRADDSTSNLDERMRRLESTVEKLARIVEAKQSSGTQPHYSEDRDRSWRFGESQSSRKSMPKADRDLFPTDVNATSADPPSIPDELRKELDKPENSLSGLENVVIRDVDTKMAIYHTNYNRKVAAAAQCKAVKAAYDADTETLDLVLESQRTRVNAELAYAQSIIDLAPLSPEIKQRRMNLIELRLDQQGRDEALQTWKEIHAKYVVGAKGGEADREAQAREQYFLFRASVESVLKDLQ
jgi:hypothetical protein